MKTQVNIVTLLLRREWSSYVDKRVLHSFILYLYYSYPTHRCFLKHLQQMTFEIIVTKGFFQNKQFLLHHNPFNAFQKLYVHFWRFSIHVHRRFQRCLLQICCKCERVLSIHGQYKMICQSYTCILTSTIKRAYSIYNE